MTQEPILDPKPFSGFWVIEREEDDITKYYTFESLSATFEIENHVIDCEHVQYFTDKAAATDCLRQIGTVIEIV